MRTEIKKTMAALLALLVSVSLMAPNLAYAIDEYIEADNELVTVEEIVDEEVTAEDPPQKEIPKEETAEEVVPQTVTFTTLNPLTADRYDEADLTDVQEPTPKSLLLYRSSSRRHRRLQQIRFQLTLRLRPYFIQYSSETSQTVLKEMEKIKLEDLNGKYRPRYALTNRQKQILSFYDMTGSDISEYADTVNMTVSIADIDNSDAF